MEFSNTSEFPPVYSTSTYVDDLIATPANAYSTPPNTFGGFQLRFPIWGLAVMTAGYAIVLIIGILGNISVIVVVAKLSYMRTVTNLYICNLALADLLVLAFCLIPNLISHIFVEWVLGDALCKIVPYVQGVSVCASVYSLVAISMERCALTQPPFSSRITNTTAKLIILRIWIGSFILALPWALFFETGKYDPDYPDLDFCIEVWPEPYQSWSTYYFLVANLFLCYIIPLSIILVSYSRIWYRMYRLPLTDPYQRVSQKEKKAALKTLAVLVLIFAFTWLAIYCISLRLKLGSPELSEFEEAVIPIAYPVAQLIGQFGSAVNPIVYGYLNKKFKHGFSMVFKCSFTNDDAMNARQRNPPRRARTANIFQRIMAALKSTSSTSYASDVV